MEWIENTQEAKPKVFTEYLIHTNWRKVVAYWEKDEYGLYHWVSTEGNSYANTVVQRFAEITDYGAK